MKYISSIWIVLDSELKTRGLAAACKVSHWKSVLFISKEARQTEFASFGEPCTVYIWPTSAEGLSCGWGGNWSSWSSSNFGLLSLSWGHLRCFWWSNVIEYISLALQSHCQQHMDYKCTWSKQFHQKKDKNWVG